MQVSWSPNHEDKFFTFGTDLCLYRVNDLLDDKVLSPKEEGMKISDRTYASLMSIATDVQYKCVAWRPHRSPDHLLAVGLNTGRVQISSFGKTSDPLGLIGKEFVPRHQKACNFLEWNPVETSLLAEGVDRYRQEGSILVWDVCSHLSSDFSTPSERKSSSENVYVTKPIYEIGPSEVSHSLSWFCNSPRTFVTGMSNKSLRIFDLRDLSRPPATSFTKSVYSVSIDRLFENRIASFHDNQITIWDTRNFDKPVLVNHQNKNLLKVSWCPTRAGFLACINKESPTLHIYDFQQFSSGGDDADPAFVERIVLPSGPNNNISSFDWHPTQRHRLLTVSPSGSVTDVHLFERVAVCWSPDIYLTWACGPQIQQFHTVKLCKESSDDISVKMRRRALKGYGIAAVMEDNVKCVSGEEKLRKLWMWISMMKELRLEGGSSSSQFQNGDFVGVKSVLSSINPSSPTEQEFWFWQGIESQTKNRSFKKVYRSEERLMALEMCGWSYSKDSYSLPIIDRLESEDKFEQAAAVSTFNLKLKRAIEVLQKGARSRDRRSSLSSESGSNLNIFAMALSGFTDEKQTLWRDLCTELGSTISHPYLRAIFYFLTTDSKTYEGILNDPKLELSDQVSFACLYLPDNKLMEYIDNLTVKYISEGNLCGILLTGLSNDGVDLFASYIDRTNDIQTAVVAILQSFSTSDLMKNSQVQHWIEIYRELLDKMRLWTERAEFDNFLCKQEKTREHDSPVYVCCNFCGKSISFESMANRNRVHNCSTGSGPPIKPRIASCPSCRKPLPRCSLCLLHMGTPAGTSKLRPGSGQLPEKKLSKIPDWFSWCQSCHHGGHAEHLTAWFQDHVECPVSGCTCRCLSVDPMSDFAINQTISSSSHDHNPPEQDDVDGMKKGGMKKKLES